MLGVIVQGLVSAGPARPECRDFPSQDHTKYDEPLAALSFSPFCSHQGRIHPAFTEVMISHVF